MALLKKRCNKFINLNSDLVICLKFDFTEILDYIQCVGIRLYIKLHLSCELAASLLGTIVTPNDAGSHNKLELIQSLIQTQNFGCWPFRKW